VVLEILLTKHMKTKSDIAAEKFLSGYNCAQAVLYAYSKELGLDTNVALQMACGFGGGIGHRQEMCGALSGAILAIGLKHGRGENQEKALVEETYRRVRELIDRFEAKHKSHTCSELIGCNFNTPEGQRQFKERDIRNTVCVECVRTAVQVLEAGLI